MQEKKFDPANDGVDVIRFYAMLAAHPFLVFFPGALVLALLGIALHFLSTLVPKEGQPAAAEAVCRISRVDRIRNCADCGDLMSVEITVLVASPKGRDDARARSAIQRAVERSLAEPIPIPRARPNPPLPGALALAAPNP